MTDPALCEHHVTVVAACTRLAHVDAETAHRIATEPQPQGGRMTLNILTPTEHAARDHRLDCPPEKYDADDGDARRCPHGVWFVYKITQRSGNRGQGNYSEAGRWCRATPMQRLRIARAKRVEEDA